MTNKITALFLAIIAANLTVQNVRTYRASNQAAPATSEVVQVIGRYKPLVAYHSMNPPPARYLVRSANGNVHFANIEYRMNDDIQYMLETSWGQYVPYIPDEQDK